MQVKLGQNNKDLIQAIVGPNKILEVGQLKLKKKTFGDKQRLLTEDVDLELTVRYRKGIRLIGISCLEY